MAVLGFGDLKDTALHALWDENEITKARLADGSSFAELLRDVDTGLGVFNASLLSMAHYANLFAVQNDLTIEYPVGVSNGFEIATEYGRPDPKRGKTSGHMLPLFPYDRGMGWTMMYLRKARRPRLMADVRSVLTDANNLWQQKLLTRLFSKAGNTVGTTSNADVPLADGGTVDATYVPLPSPEGETFLYTHNHFLGYGTSGITQDTIDASAVAVAVEHLQEHGHAGPWTLIGSRTDVATWGDVTGFKPPLYAGIAYQASAVERAQISGVDEYYGFIETDYGIVQVWLTPRVPTKNFCIYKPYGSGDPRNPLRVRIDENVWFGFRTVPGNWVNAPEQMIIAYTEFGVGIGEDRTNGVCVDLEASTYTDPTIS